MGGQGDHNEMAGGRVFFESLGRLQTVHSGQAQVHEDEVRHGFAGEAQTYFGILSLENTEAVGFEQIGSELEVEQVSSIMSMVLAAIIFVRLEEIRQWRGK